MNWDAHLYPNEVRHLMALADDGDALAANYLYHYYAGYMCDDVQAANWLRKAAEAGDPEAQYYLGKMLAHLGRGPRTC